MPHGQAREDLEEALRHAAAGQKALESALKSATETGQVYPTHIYVASVELAHAIETAMKVALRSQ